MSALIQLAVDETNQSYVNSQVSPRYKLAFSYQVSYTEAGYGTDLERFKGTADGYMDEVHTYRSEYTADMCAMIFNDPSLCGVAYTILADATTAFCLVHYDCGTGYFSFGHELGHLQGARHNPEVDPTTTPFPYGHGYLHCPAPVFRTIMAYPACSSTRVQYWANPNVLYGGVPMGTAAVSDDHRVLNETATTMDGFAPDDLVLSSGSISSTKTYEAENTVTAQTAYTVLSGGNVTFRAGGQISLEPGFTASNGSAFRATVDGTLGTPAQIFAIAGRSSALNPVTPQKPAPDAQPDQRPRSPSTYDLASNYPNPFNPSTIISYGVPEEGRVVLKIYNTLGQEVRTIVDEVQPAGNRSVEFNASSLPSGMYFYRLQAGGFSSVKKMMLLR